MRKWTLFLILLCGQILAADEEILLTRQAEAYFEAHEYEKALNLFGKIAQGKLENWQRERLFFNIGTIYLEEGKWQEATEEFAEISVEEGKSNFLMRALKTNQAVLLFREGSTLLLQKDSKLEDLRKAIFLFRDALIRLQEANDSACMLEEVYGKGTCRITEDIAELNASIKSQLAIALDKYGESIIASSSVQDGLPFLLSGVKLAISHLNFLESKVFDDNLKEKYLMLFTRDIESWGLLWDAQLAQLDQLETAYYYYLDGIEKMKNRKLEESRLDFISSEAYLSDLIRALFGKDPLVNLFQNLLTAYRRALIQVPIQSIALYQIETLQAQVEEIAKKRASEIEKLSESTVFLKKSMEALKQGKTILTRFFLYEAKEKVVLLIRKKLGDEKTPEKILTDAIEDEAHAVILNRISQELEKNWDSVLPSLKSSQEEALNTAGSFYSIVLEKQIKEFAESCQCKPWNQVIPLFEKGNLAAEEAMKLIKQGERPHFAATFQEKAEKYWREALEKMKHPDEQKKPKPEKEKKEMPEPLEKEEKKEESVQDVMKRLQQMSQDDRRPEPKPAKPREQGARPW